MTFIYQLILTVATKHHGKGANNFGIKGFHFYIFCKDTMS